MLFSKTTGGFYSREIHGTSIPEDAVEISEDRHRELIDGQAQGKIIVADSDGYPDIIDPPPPSGVKLIASKKQAIRDMEQAAWDGYMKVSRQFMINTFEALAAQQGISKETLYLGNKGYKAMVDLEAAIVPLREEINTLEKSL